MIAARVFAVLMTLRKPAAVKTAWIYVMAQPNPAFMNGNSALAMTRIVRPPNLIDAKITAVVPAKPIVKTWARALPLALTTALAPAMLPISVLTAFIVLTRQAIAARIPNLLLRPEPATVTSWVALIVSMTAD